MARTASLTGTSITFVEEAVTISDTTGNSYPDVDLAITSFEKDKLLVSWCRNSTSASSTMENNIYTCTYTTAYSTFAQVGIYKTLSYVKSHVYYMSIECKGQGDMRISFAGKSYNFPLQSEWKQVSALWSATSTSQFNTWIGPCIGAGYKIGQQSQFKNMRIYDLTEIYGAGNEPDLIWCDVNL